ncbi:MAG: MBL fold metallo-hydrolase [Campylobacterales bacterium]|nr:MBL fold metallo-hydrolase [Campylobacterales bacterium]
MKPLWAVVLTVSALGAFECGLKPVHVNDKRYCFFGAPEVMNTHNNGNMVNTCFVDAGKSYLVIDSGPTYLYAKEAHMQMNALKAMKVSHVINTHVHDDHWLGNGYFLSQGALLAGPTPFEQATHSSQTPRMALRISKQAYEGTMPTPPFKLIAQSGSLHVNDMEVRIVHVDHKAHTSGDLFIYIPSIKTIFAGDLVFNDRLPSLRDGDINGWIAALEQIAAYKANHIVGGHGTRFDAKAHEFTYGYLTRLRDEVRAAIEEGVAIDAALERIVMSEYKSAAMYDVMHRANVEAAYRMLEWEE